MSMLSNIFSRLSIGCLMISVSWAQAPDRQKRAAEKIIYRGARVDSIGEALRDPRVGCIFVTSAPLQAEIWGIRGDSIIFRETTPVLLCDLFTRAYQIVFAKAGFEKRRVGVKPKPGRVDTLHVSLKPTTFRLRSSVSTGTALAGIAGVGALVVAVAVLLKPDHNNGTNVTADLPTPPDRP